MLAGLNPVTQGRAGQALAAGRRRIYWSAGGFVIEGLLLLNSR
jgi:hypothetical protein